MKYFLSALLVFIFLVNVAFAQEQLLLNKLKDTLIQLQVSLSASIGYSNLEQPVLDKLGGLLQKVRDYLYKIVGSCEVGYGGNGNCTLTCKSGNASASCSLGGGGTCVRGAPGQGYCWSIHENCETHVYLVCFGGQCTRTVKTNGDCGQAW
jgi:hypothetical protein